MVHTGPQSSRHLCLDERCLTAAGERVLSRPEMSSMFVVIWLLTLAVKNCTKAKGPVSLELPSKTLKTSRRAEHSSSSLSNVNRMFAQSISTKHYSYIVHGAFFFFFLKRFNWTFI